MNLNMYNADILAMFSKTSVSPNLVKNVESLS